MARASRSSLATLLLLAAAPLIAKPLDARGFEALLGRLADGWNRGDAAHAADQFTPDAIYTEPPGRQVYRGRAELFRFFGGAEGRPSMAGGPGAMQMTWHRIAFDPSAQRGFGEFSFRYGSQVHGVAVIDVRDGRIAQWREYFTRSELPFAAFAAPSRP